MKKTLIAAAAVLMLSTAIAACKQGTTADAVGGTGSEFERKLDIMKTELGYVSAVQVMLTNGDVVQCVILDSWDGGGGITCDWAQSTEGEF